MHSNGQNESSMLFDFGMQQLLKGKGQTDLNLASVWCKFIANYSSTCLLCCCYSPAQLRKTQEKCFYGPVKLCITCQPWSNRGMNVFNFLSGEMAKHFRTRIVLRLGTFCGRSACRSNLWHALQTHLCFNIVKCLQAICTSLIKRTDWANNFWWKPMMMIHSHIKNYQSCSMNIIQKYRVNL